MEAVRSVAIATTTLPPRRLYVLPYLLILPTVFMILSFTVWPTISAVIQSTFRVEGLQKTAQFVGLANYTDLVDPNVDIGQVFPQVFVNTVVFVIITVPVSMALAFLLALMLNRKMKTIALFRFAFFYPVLMPMIGAASLFAFLYADQIGLVNVVLASLHLSTPKWIGGGIALVSVMIVVIWKQVGFYMIIYLAGLQNLPEDVYEAAQLDGANWWVEIRRITWPLLSSTTLFILTSAVAMAFQTVDQLYALGQGGPGDRSNLLLYLIYQRYTDVHNTGYVNAITVILLAILLAFTIVNFLLSEGRVYYASDSE
ncbi:MAG TPA: sugar ABC transporter permease [Aggregatilineaceae bacterium]|nr:sugar ABC transporter permease [Aggregatilineaceae bacterium]